MNFSLNIANLFFSKIYLYNLKNQYFEIFFSPERNSIRVIEADIEGLFLGFSGNFNAHKKIGIDIPK